MAGARSVGVWRVWVPDFGHCGDDLSGHANPFAGVVSRHVVVDHPKERGQRLGAAKSVGAETIQDRLDDAASIAYLKKALVVVAAQEDGPGIGRIRMRQMVDASAESLMPFVRDSVAPGSVVHTDGWLGYVPLKSKGYEHEVTFLKGNKKTPSELMPRVHRVISLLKRWLMGTHQGAVSHKHLDSYLDEFTFRFNRRRSQSRGKLFFRLAQQAVTVDPVTYYGIVHPRSRKSKPQSVGVT